MLLNGEPLSEDTNNMYTSFFIIVSDIYQPTIGCCIGPIFSKTLLINTGPFCGIAFRPKNAK